MHRFEINKVVAELIWWL